MFYASFKVNNWLQYIATNQKCLGLFGLYCSDLKLYMTRAFGVSPSGQEHLAYLHLESGCYPDYRPTAPWSCAFLQIYSDAPLVHQFLQWWLYHFFYPCIQYSLHRTFAKQLSPGLLPVSPLANLHSHVELLVFGYLIPGRLTDALLVSLQFFYWTHVALCPERVAFEWFCLIFSRVYNDKEGNGKRDERIMSILFRRVCTNNLSFSLQENPRLHIVFF